MRNAEEKEQMQKAIWITKSFNASKQKSLEKVCRSFIFSFRIADTLIAF